VLNSFPWITYTFNVIDERHIAIRPAHAKTFSWIIEASSASTNEWRPSVKFVEWLQSESSLYWVSGKPGSGQSTLMKYLLGHWLTQRNLDVWAEDYQLITASFFWNARRISLQK
jgi:ABC-type molybdenum transport system ATPase subunit/photorepair protein PhrA